MPRPAGLHALRHPAFRLLAGGQLASSVGDALYAVALPWYVLADHGGALLLALVLAAYGIPRTVLVAIGGHASDRWRPWTVMIVADAVRLGAVAALAVAVLSGPAHAAVLVPIAVVLGAGEGLFLPASFAIIPSLLPDRDLQAGNALAMGGTQLATLIGPALGGALVALAGPAPAFLADAASFAVSATTLIGIRRLRTSAEPAATESVPGVGHSLPSVGRMLRDERALQIILVITVAGNLGLGATSEVALPALAHGPLHAGATGYGILIAAFGGGALLGTLLAGGRHVRRPAVVGSAAFLGEAVAMALVPYLGGTVAAATMLAAFGALNGFGNVLTVTAFQRWARPDVLGQLMGLLLLASFGVFPVSVLIGGVVVHDLGPAPMFVIGSVVMAAAVLTGLTQPLWREFGATAEMPLRPLGDDEALRAAASTSAGAVR
jgi:predicted MFS family arabinose efflux permease